MNTQKPRDVVKMLNGLFDELVVVDNVRQLVVVRDHGRVPRRQERGKRVSASVEHDIVVLPSAARL